MIKKQKETFQWFCYDHFSKHEEIEHIVTTRFGGISKYEFASFNLSFKVDEEKRITKQNREKLSELLGVDSGRMLFPGQVHGTNICVIRDMQEVKESLLKDTDAVVTQVPGLFIFVLAADCVPLLIFDPVKKVVAAVHAGWRGTVNQIAKKTVIKMIEVYGICPDDVKVGIGPSIGVGNYEVGEEIIQYFKDIFPSQINRFAFLENNQCYLDLWKANKIQLEGIGVKPENIEISGMCTVDYCDVFYSHRASGGKTGRFANGIMIK